jgi:small subunit ribosomal protein S14
MRNKKIKRKIGKGSKKCVRCGSMDGIIRKYNLYYCRRCFREVAYDLGFRKFG